MLAALVHIPLLVGGAQQKVNRKIPPRSLTGALGRRLFPMGRRLCLERSPAERDASPGGASPGGEAIFMPFASKLFFCYESHTSGAAVRARPV